MTWQEWIKLNYHWLEAYASIYGELKTDCLTHLCLYFNDENWHKFYKIPDHEKPKWIRAYFRNQVRWKNSDVSRDNRTNSLTEEQIDAFYYSDKESEDEHVNIEIGSEEASEDVKAWIADCSRQFGESKTDKLLQIKIIFHKQLSLSEQILYGLYFDEMMTHRQIAQRLRIPLTSSFIMVKKLENKLIELCNSTGTQSFS